ncbi:hypothetical protein PDJAM_G00078000 [Pangasius djambal]|uniref:Uncharacterized protein n=1 Tax=Pangasius djambal TaxID=1691987 RepID=A0ACC5Z253_9TELE|nr:hypothetical protein [Pangasius djambal]
MFPANLVQATFQQYRTNSVPVMKTLRTTESSSVTRRTLIYNLQDDNGNSENGSDVRNFQLDLTPPPDVVMRTQPGTSEGMNVLGIVIFSATMGKKTHTNTHLQHRRK